METELKFRVLDTLKARELEQVDWAPYRLASRVVHHLHDTMLDTAERDLTGSRHGLRVRQDGETTYLTLKNPGGTQKGARHAREEWESTIPSDAADNPSRWPDEIRTRVAELVQDRLLEPIAEVENKRRTWEVWHADTLVAELALDLGELRSGTSVEAFNEIEIELKGDGTDDDLRVLAQRLKQTLPLADEPRTKLERSLALLDDARDHNEKPAGPHGDVAMMADAPLAEAGRSILWTQWEKLQESEPGVRAGDHEAVHDMRVATRRMRAILEVLGATVYRVEVVQPLRKGLKRLADGLGVVRDAEVWLLSLETYSQQLAEDERPGLDPLLLELHTRRDAGRHDFLDMLQGKRTHRLFDDVERFLSTPGAGVRVDDARRTGPPRVRDMAGSALWARLEAVRAYGDVMPQAPLETMHELRIACKKLRYTVELFGDVLGADGKRLREQLTAAQDHLGALQDADVAIPILDRLIVTEPHNLTLQRYRAHLQETRDQLWASADDVWKIVGGKAMRKSLASMITKL